MDQHLSDPDWPLLIGTLEREERELKAAEIRTEVARVNYRAMIRIGVSHDEAKAWCDLPSRERRAKLDARRASLKSDGAK